MQILDSKLFLALLDLFSLWPTWWQSTILSLSHCQPSQLNPSVTCLCCPGPEFLLSTGRHTRWHQLVPLWRQPQHSLMVTAFVTRAHKYQTKHWLCISVDDFLYSASTFLQGRICWFLWANSSLNTTGSWTPKAFRENCNVNNCHYSSTSKVIISKRFYSFAT